MQNEILLSLLTLLLLASTHAQSASDPAETQCLVFQVWPAQHGYPDLPPQPGHFTLSKAQMAEFVRDVAKAIGTTGDAPFFRK